MGKANVVKNYMYNLVYQILLLILPLVTTPYISRVLGAESIGIYSYTISIITYFVLFGSLGVAMYAQREIAFVQDSKVRRSRVFWETFFLRAITLGISMVVFFFAFAFKGDYALYYRILLLYILANIFDISYVFQGLEEFKKLVARNLIVKILSIISVFLFIRKPGDVNIYLLIYSLSNLLGNLSLWMYLPKYILPPNLRRMSLVKHIKPTLIMFMPQIATQIYTVLDKAMLGTLLSDKAEVGFYEQSQKVVVVLMTVITSLGTVMLPHMANKFAQGKDDEIKESIMNSFRLVLILAIPMVCGLCIVAPDFMPMFLGEGYDKTVAITWVISPIILMIGLSNVIGIQYLLPTKRQNLLTVSVTSGAVINFIFNLILIPHFKSIGSAIATLIAETTVTLVQFIFVRREFNLKSIFLSALKYLLASAVMFAVIRFLNIFVLHSIYRSVRVITDVLVGMLAYASVLIILRDRFLIDGVKHILKKD